MGLSPHTPGMGEEGVWRMWPGPIAHTRVPTGDSAIKQSPLPGQLPWTVGRESGSLAPHPGLGPWEVRAS